MLPLNFLWVDVFTEAPFSGNPLAVFPNADSLDTEAMQTIAAEVGLSESVFATAADWQRAVFDVRIMTPTSELPFAGHPTIGTVVAVAELYRRKRAQVPETIRLNEAVGPVDLTVELGAASRGWAKFEAPRVPEPVDTTLSRTEAAALLGLSEDSIADDQIFAWSAGVPFTFIPLMDGASLAAVKFSREIWKETLSDQLAPHVFVYVRDSDSPEQLEARMFAPALGIQEDPATGAAGVALSADIARRGAVTNGSVRGMIMQGEAMGRPSKLIFEADVENAGISKVELAGDAVIAGEGQFNLDG